jgi:hypothetical protein
MLQEILILTPVLVVLAVQEVVDRREAVIIMLQELVVAQPQDREIRVVLLGLAPLMVILDLAVVVVLALLVLLLQLLHLVTVGQVQHLLYQVLL